MMKSAWMTYALGAAFFAALTAVFGKLGVSGLNANLATLIRTVVVLVLLGQVLELRARSRTSAAIRNLLGLAPKTARRVETDGTERDVSVRHGLAQEPDDPARPEHQRVADGDHVTHDAHRLVDGVLQQRVLVVDHAVPGRPQAEDLGPVVRAQVLQEHRPLPIGNPVCAGQVRAS